MSIAFDSSVLIDYLNSNKEFLKTMMARKQSGWLFIYLDYVRREVMKGEIKEIYKEVESMFDKKVSLNRFPIILPVTLMSKEDNERERRFINLGNISKEDAIIIAEAIRIRCNFLVTTDGPLLRNSHATYEAQKEGLNIVSPRELIDFINVTGQA